MAWSASDSELAGRIDEGLRAATEVLNGFVPGEVAAETKGVDDPVTAADRAVD